MYFRVSIGRVKAGCWQQYEQVHKHCVEPHVPAEGRIGRWLIRAISDPDFGLSMTMWEKREDMETYERSDAIARDVLSRITPCSAEFTAHHCEVRFRHLFDANGVTSESDPMF